jgi:16S rRNA (uracil1498-N3)-methyltransferase
MMAGRFMGRIPLFFVQSDSLKVGDSLLELDHDEAAHCRARRVGVGDRIALTDGNGLGGYGVVLDMGRKRVRVELERVFETSDDRVPVELVCAIIKRERMNWAISKAAEAGVRRIHPVYSRYSVARQDSRRDAVRVERWNKLCAEALKQSGGDFVTLVTRPVSLEEFLLSMVPGSSNVVLSRDAGMSMRAAWHQQGSRLPMVVFIGPEGGFSNEEFEVFRENGFAEASLCRRILRSETSVAVAAVLAGQVVG